MKVYFTASISGRDKYLDNYKRIVKILSDLGYKVLEDTIDVSQKYVYDETSDEDKVDYYKQVLKWMNAADIVVVEATHPSLSIGHEISIALEKNKPVVVLYCEGNAPHFLIGVKTEKLVVEKYSLENLKKTLAGALEYASNQQDTRFNFFISPRIGMYLENIAHDKRLPRAVYLRNLIEEHMNNNEEYKNY